MIKSLDENYRHWSKNGGVYMISDTHFNDVDCKLMDPNWITPEEHISRINKVVHKNDTLVHLGDVGDVSYISKLKAGYKVLIMGNHDKGRSNYERKISKFEYNFPTVQDARNAVKSGVISSYKYEYKNVKITNYMNDKEIKDSRMLYELVDLGLVNKSMFEFFNPVIVGYKDNNLFDEVHEGPLTIAKNLIISHEPVNLVSNIKDTIVSFNIHGHVHNEIEELYGLNITSNVIGFELVNLGKLIDSGILRRVRDIHRITIDNASGVLM